MIRVASAIAVLIALVGAGSASAASMQQVGFFDKPIYVTSAPNDADRLFVVEREGRIEQTVNGTVTNFADLGPVVSCCAGERGLLSIALAPDFAGSGRLFVAYTGFEGELHVGELRATGATAPLSSLRDVLVVPHPGQSNHNGGQLQFGPEGLLYISTGDGGGQDDELDNAQKLSSQLGKILRIDPQPSGLLGYTVPPANPYAGGAPEDDTVWASGLRNPYRFSFDRLTGGLWIGDVGQSQSEEVDHAALGTGAGANYGWACREGLLPGPKAADPECATEPPGGFVAPVFSYPHDDPGPGGPRCAIIGGYVVRDADLPDLYGRYVYGDYCNGGIRSFDPAAPAASDRPEGLEVAHLTSFGEDSCGRVYTASEAGWVSRLLNYSPSTCAQLAQSVSFVGIKAQSRKVKRRKRAQITAWVSPCQGRRGEPVKLFRGRRHLATRRLDSACSVRFRPRITRRATFRATVAADVDYIAATSRKLRVKILHRKPGKRQRSQR